MKKLALEFSPSSYTYPLSLTVFGFKTGHHFMTMMCDQWSPCSELMVALWPLSATAAHLLASFVVLSCSKTETCQKRPPRSGEPVFVINSRVLTGFYLCSVKRHDVWTNLRFVAQCWDLCLDSTRPRVIKIIISSSIPSQDTTAKIQIDQQSSAEIEIFLLL